MNRIGIFGVLLAGLVGFGVALFTGGGGCDGSDTPVCGNGVVERGEQCDCGTDPTQLPSGCYQVNGGANSGCSASCRLRSVVTNQVRVHWTINGESILGSGSFDTCNEVGSPFVRVHLEGASGYVADRSRVSCGDYNVAFTDDPAGGQLVPGTYTVTVELQSAEEVPVAPARDATFVLSPGMDNEVVVNFPLETFYDYASMRGTLLYRLFWGMEGVLCGDATEPVVTRSVTLGQNGTPLAGYPDTGACSDATQEVPDLVPGEYDFRAEGYDGQGTMRFCYAGRVKVGAGVQPAYQIVVPTLDASACPE